MTLGVSQLFAEKPHKWGLRGDPHIWQTIKTLCQHLPQSTSAEDMEGFLKECFRVMVHEDLQQGRKTYLKPLDHGGMSGGLVSHDFWLETAFPLLLSRWQQAQNQVNNPFF